MYPWYLLNRVQIHQYLKLLPLARFFSWTLNFCVTSYLWMEMKKKWKSHQLIIAKEVWMVKEVKGGDGYFVRFRLCRCLSWLMTHESNLKLDAIAIYAPSQFAKKHCSVEFQFLSHNFVQVTRLHWATTDQGEVFWHFLVEQWRWNI